MKLLLEIWSRWYKLNIEKLRQKAYENILDIVKIIQQSSFDFLNNLDTVKFRVKSEESIKRKAMKFDGDITKIYDLIGIRYVLFKKDYSNLLKESITNINCFEVKRIKDYSSSGHPDDPNYKAIHLRMMYNDLPVEVQIMDSKMNELEAKTHTDYKEGLLRRK